MGKEQDELAIQKYVEGKMGQAMDAMEEQLFIERRLHGEGSESLVPSRSWESVGYMIAAEVKIVQRGFKQVPDCNKVVGRAMGLRDDGQTFVASVDLPWVWPEGFEWQPRALTRLNTFLNCECLAQNGQTRLCEIHEELNRQWNEEDWKTNEWSRKKREEVETMPLIGRESGVLDNLRMINRQYPWCRRDVVKTEWVCLICNFRQAAFDNGSWQNQFILEHSRCGFPEPWQKGVDIKESPEDQILRGVAAELEKMWYQRRYPNADDLRAAVLNMRGKIVVDEGNIKWRPADEVV
jgi:hypothetical protein